MLKIINQNKIFRSLNKYFFDDEEITMSDALYFYGFFAICVVVGTIAATIYFMNR